MGARVCLSKDLGLGHVSVSWRELGMGAGSCWLIPLASPPPTALPNPGCPEPASSDSRCSLAAEPDCLMTLCTLTRLILLSSCPGQPPSSPPLLPARRFQEASCPELETGCLSLGHLLGSLTSHSHWVSAALPTLASPSLNIGSQLSGERRLCTRKMVNKMVWIYFSITTSRHCQPLPLKSLSQAKLQT